MFAQRASTDPDLVTFAISRSAGAAFVRSARSDDLAVYGFLTGKVLGLEKSSAPLEKHSYGSEEGSSTVFLVLVSFVL